MIAFMGSIPWIQVMKIKGKKLIKTCECCAHAATLVLRTSCNNVAHIMQQCCAHPATSHQAIKVTYYPTLLFLVICLGCILVFDYFIMLTVRSLIWLVSWKDNCNEILAMSVNQRYSCLKLLSILITGIIINHLRANRKYIVGL